MSTSRLGVAATGAAMVLLCSGVAAAAVVTDDPTGTSSPTTSSTGEPGAKGRGAEKAKGGVGPNAAGPAHHGLCTAWSHVKDTPGHAADSPAFRNVQKVGCDDVATAPGSEGDSTARGRGKDAGKDHGNGKAKGKGHGQDQDTDEDEDAPTG